MGNLQVLTHINMLSRKSKLFLFEYLINKIIIVIDISQNTGHQQTKWSFGKAV